MPLLGLSILNLLNEKKKKKYRKAPKELKSHPGNNELPASEDKKKGELLCPHGGEVSTHMT